ncbi:L-rhamnose mutarotase [Salinarchaeum laminariae]|uniref:L-rhamnose mutarotase n=1 Tax=Salinarchaeum laminariae TaxID=869888 RepID=UPI0020BF0C10|nr:L-rhamnose mutarotase [Salinarchaeum laminariae]
MSADKSDDLERIVTVQRLKSDAVDDYVAAHDDVPDSVVEAMEDGGVAEYELYVDGDIAIGIMEVEDLEAFEDVYGSDPDNQKWEERVGEFKQSGVDPDEMEMPVMERIWSLGDECE